MLKCTNLSKICEYRVNGFECNRTAPCGISYSINKIDTEISKLPKRTFNGEHFVKLNIEQDLNIFEPTEIQKITHKIACEIVDKENETIISAIREHAKKMGVTDLILIDEEFITSAITNELERRKVNG